MVDEKQRSKGKLVKGGCARPCKRTVCGFSPDLMRRPPSSDGYSMQFAVERKSYILLNENYIGNIVYNRTTRSLGQKQMSNPQERWVRGWQLSLQSSIPASLRAHKNS